MYNVCPVIVWFSARYRQAFATSSSVLRLRMGTLGKSLSSAFGFTPGGESTRPGATVLTRMSGAHSKAAASLADASAFFASAYIPAAGSVNAVRWSPKLTMAPFLQCSLNERRFGAHMKIGTTYKQ